ncbi:hypothetical protein BCR32DRAFT_275195 [Anaeromyces robustus]|uniref:Uncharacterized protein n=1 Tax=Anaeromyces robustus TaxID=1754192 RepID=A0A1Y1XLW0_9FUNG|nr:hypothetical protein BCR32DRAFT_275195 [Anaeromyces robustus]|eukprot:ORX86693.1 hypothetical protein BCR32DRAFT_275195 [Anaeromyces robustus]
MEIKINVVVNGPLLNKINNETAIFKACLNENKKLVKYLIEGNKILLFNACQSRNDNLAKYLIELKGANINIR